MAMVMISEVPKTSKVEILGYVFNGLDSIKKAVECYWRIGHGPLSTDPKCPVDGVHVVCIYEPYPCFDAEDYANENREYCNYFFSNQPFTRQKIARLSRLPGRCNAQMVSASMPEWAVPAVYYRGEGNTMIVATLA